MEEIFLIARWKNIPLTARQYLEFSKGLLLKLQAFDPRWFGWGGHPASGQDFKDDLSDFEALTLPEIKAEDTIYDNPDPANIDITLDSTCWKGFLNIYGNTVPETAWKIRLSISAGASMGETNSVVMDFPPQVDAPFYDYAYMAALFKLVIEHCDPDYAFVTSYKFWKTVEIPDAKIKCPIGWLSYLANSAVASALPPGTEYELSSYDSPIITLMRELPSAENPEHVARALHIRDALRQRGYL